MKSTESNLEHSAAADQLRARKDLVKLFQKHPMDVEDALFNLPMFMRSGVLAKVLVMADLYKRFVNVPGVLVEFGTWFGMNLVLLENLRAVYEPFNKQRRILGFDSFEGYYEGRFGGTGLYSTGRKYIRYLEKLLKCHAGMNVYPHIPAAHELIEGDVCDTAPAYFAAHPELTVAFAYVDMGPYEPTLAALRAIKSHLVSGSVILLDEFTWSEMPGEAMAFGETFSRDEYTIEKCVLYPSKAIVTIK